MDSQEKGSSTPSLDLEGAKGPSLNMGGPCEEASISKSLEIHVTILVAVGLEESVLALVNS